MLASDSLRFLFIHVQKTGGTTVEHVLKKTVPDVKRPESCPKHSGLRIVLRNNPEVARLAQQWFLRYLSRAVSTTAERASMR